MQTTKNSLPGLKEKKVPAKKGYYRFSLQNGRAFQAGNLPFNQHDHSDYQPDD